MKSKGIAFADLFDPDVMGDGPTAPGYMVNGVPLRFAALKYGTKRADVGYAENGIDVSNKWAAKGTAVYQTVNVLPLWHIFIPLHWTGPSGLGYALSLMKTGKGQRNPGPTEPDQIFDWTSDGNPPLRAYEVRLINVVQAGDPVWAFTNLVPSWSPLNAQTSQTIARFNYNSSSATGEQGKTVDARLEIRDAATLEVVEATDVSWSAASGSAI